MIEGGKLVVCESGWRMWKIMSRYYHFGNDSKKRGSNPSGSPNISYIHTTQQNWFVSSLVVICDRSFFLVQQYYTMDSSMQYWPCLVQFYLYRRQSRTWRRESARSLCSCSLRAEQVPHYRYSSLNRSPQYGAIQYSKVCIPEGTRFKIYRVHRTRKLSDLSKCKRCESKQLGDRFCFIKRKITQWWKSQLPSTSGLIVILVHYNTKDYVITFEDEAVITLRLLKRIVLVVVKTDDYDERCDGLRVGVICV